MLFDLDGSPRRLGLPVAALALGKGPATRKCIGPVLTFGISDRTNAEVKAVVCDSPESDTSLGEVTIEEPVIVYRGRARTAEEFLYDFVKRHAKPSGSAGSNQDQ